MKRAKTGGRRKGTPNRITSDLKVAIMQTFDQVGGIAYLSRIANEQPHVFCSLLGKVLPLQVTGRDGRPVTLEMMVMASFSTSRSDNTLASSCKADSLSVSR